MVSKKPKLQNCHSTPPPNKTFLKIKISNPHKVQPHCCSSGTLFTVWGEDQWEQSRVTVKEMGREVRTTLPFPDNSQGAVWVTGRWAQEWDLEINGQLAREDWGLCCPGQARDEGVPEDFVSMATGTGLGQKQVTDESTELIHLYDWVIFHRVNKPRCISQVSAGGYFNYF